MGGLRVISSIYNEIETLDILFESKSIIAKQLPTMFISLKEI